MAQPVFKTHSVISTLCVFLGGLVIGSLFIAVCPLSENTDYLGFYRPIAERILDGHGVTHPNDQPATRYPPGYPIFIAACYAATDIVGMDREQGILCLQAMLYGISGVLIFMMAEKLYPRQAIPCLLAAILWLCNPINLLLLKQPNSEIPFIAFFYLALWLTLGCITDNHTKGGKPPPWQCMLTMGLFIGILSGISMLIRPIAIGISVIFAGAVLVLPRRNIPLRWRGVCAGAILAGTTLVVAPWECWVFSHGGDWIPLSTGGGASIRDGLTFAVRDEGYRKPVALPPDARAAMNNMAIRYGEMSNLRGIITVVSDTYHQYPLGVITVMVAKAGRCFYATNSGEHDRYVMWGQLIFLAGIGFACAKMWPSNPQPIVFFLLVVVYFWGMTFMVLSILRYMQPMLGALTVFLPVIAWPPALRPVFMSHASTSPRDHACRITNGKN
jgi:hypothetical protein